MDPDSPPHASVMLHEYFPVEYQLSGGSSHNSEFRGSGTLTILGAGGEFQFEGRRRALFSRKPLVREIGNGSIYNVCLLYTSRCV